MRRQCLPAFRSAFSLLIFFGLTSVLSGDDQTGKSFPDFFFDKAEQTVTANLLGGALQYDGDVVLMNGQSWYTWLEFLPGKGDVIWVGTRKDSAWKSQQQAMAEPGEYAAPTLTVDRQGRLWLSYEARNGDCWDIYLVKIQDGKPVGQPRLISNSSGSNTHHRTAASASGLWVVWQSDRDGQFDIVARQVENDETGDIYVISENSHGDWHPSIAADSRGGFHVAWDAYDGNAFNVRLRSFRHGKWQETIDVTNSPAYEGRTDVIADKQGRLWIVWEEGGTNWGKPFRGINTTTLRDHKGPLHRFRKIRLAVLDSSGELQQLKNPLPMPSVNLASLRTGARPDSKQLGAFYERAKLSTDSAGRVWLLYRHYYTPWLGIAHRSHVEEGWGVYARCYTADGWSPMVRMSIGQGDGLQRLEVSPYQDGVIAVWTTGRTHRTKNKRPRGLVAATLTAAGKAPVTIPLKKLEVAKREKPQPESEMPETVSVGGKTYHLFYGDLHRHTDLSLCRVPIDGTLDDAYRYAIEVVQLDFLGITDHSRDIAQGNPLSQLWWRSRKEVYRHQLAVGDGLRFAPFYSYERSHSNTADHNVISLRGDMLRPHTYPVPKFWKELDSDTMTIPHQPIRRDTWKYQDDALRPLVEVFQGCRDNSIEEYVHRGLDKGYHLGFIASSDHMSTSASFACVWAERPTRESIFRAMQARRTFAATDKIWLTVRVGDHWMGEVIHDQKTPRLELNARGTAPIRIVNLVVDGKPYQTWSPSEQSLSLDCALDVEGKHYAYFHLVQSDGNEAWSSPIWLDNGE